MTKNDALPVPDGHFDVFISYSSRDVVHAEALERVLNAAGLTVWRDKTRLKGGEHVGFAIPKALQGAGALAVIWSDNAVQSDYVRFETDYAVGAGKFAAVAVDDFDYRTLHSLVRDCHCEKLSEVLADPSKLKQRILELGKAPFAGQQIRHADIRPVPGFVGREEMLGVLKEKLWQGGGKSTVAIRNASGGIIAMRGLGGVGKTVLARHYAWEQREEYHGIWWLRPEAHDTLVDDLVALGRRIGLHFADDTEPEDAAQQTLDRIAQGRTPKPWLLVYDNVEDKALVRRFTPSENAHLLYTTRLPDWFGEADELPVDVFPRETAINFLLAYASGETRETAGQLADALGRLPLALAHARAYCRTRRKPFDRYREQLAGLLDAMPKDADTDYPRTVYATFSLAMDRATEECGGAQRLMGLIAHFAPDQIPLWLIPETVMPEGTRDDALEVLQRLSLVAHDTLADGTPAISVHRLVQEVVRARLCKTGEAEKYAAEAVTLIYDAYDEEAISYDTHLKWTSWLPHALASLPHAPYEGEAARNTWAVHQFIGDFRIRRGELSRAKEAYETGMKIVQELAAASPDNTRWQRDVSVSLNKIADVHLASGDAKGALANYQKSLAIREALAAADPQRPEWQRDVSVSLERIADVLRAAGDAKGALANYQKSLAIAEALAAADPQHVGWQRDVAISCSRVGMVAAQDGQVGEALVQFRRGRDILAKLMQIMPEDAALPKQLAAFDQLIAVVDGTGAENDVGRTR